MRHLLPALAVGLTLSLSGCTDDGTDTDAQVSTCDFVPRDVVAAALALPGQTADDLELTGGDYDPALDGTSDAETGPLMNECTAGDPSVATVRVTSLVQDTPAGTPEEVVGQSCDAVEPFPATVDAVGGTCLAVSTEARGRWGDQRIVVQLFRTDGQQPTDRDVVIDIAQKFAEASASA